MAHVNHNIDPDDRTMLTARVLPVIKYAQIVAVAGFVLSLAVGAMTDGGFTRFYHAYLVSFAFFLSIALGSLFFVMIHHLTRAGWSVAVRRVAEVCAATMPMMAVCFAPIAVAVLVNEAELYPWAKPVGHDAHHVADHGAAKPGAVEPGATTGGATAVETPSLEASHAAGEPHNGGVSPSIVDPHTEDLLAAKKRAYLNPAFFLSRFAIYFAAWTGLALWLWRQSTQQDKTGDAAHSHRMHSASAGGMWLFAVTITFGAFDLLMSLSPGWYSTIFGVYFFTGAVVAAFAAIILICAGLQRLGFLTRTITAEHYHDLGKYLLGFVFFWGYIAFSQYMLIWYANLPETTFWFAQRGASTHPAHFSGWSIVSIALVLGHFLIPFLGLMSRHVKRKTTSLVFWAAWVLVFHWIDLWWIVLPELGPAVRFGVPEVATFLAVAGVFAATALRIAKLNKLVPVSDPRLPESIAFENI